MVGEGWPLTIERTYYEYRALVAERSFVSDLVPEVFHFDKKNSLLGNLLY